MRKKHTRIVCLFIVTATVTGCEPDGVSESQMERENRQLLETDRAFAKYSMSHGAAEAFRLYLQESAVQLPNGGEPILGRNAIVEALRNSGNYSFAWEPVDGSVASSKDLGYTWGYYIVRSNTSGQDAVRMGKYLNVWEKNPDGLWKVSVDMGNTGARTE